MVSIRVLITYYLLLCSSVRGTADGRVPSLRAGAYPTALETVAMTFMVSGSATLSPPGLQT